MERWTVRFALFYGLVIAGQLDSQFPYTRNAKRLERLIPYPPSSNNSPLKTPEWELNDLLQLHSLSIRNQFRDRTPPLSNSSKHWIISLFIHIIWRTSSKFSFLWFGAFNWFAAFVLPKSNWKPWLLPQWRYYYNDTVFCLLLGL